MARTVKLTVRLSGNEKAQLQRAAKDRGYLSPTAFIRAAIRNELSGRQSELTDAEQRIAATLERASQDIFRVYRGQQGLFAVVDTLVRIFLTCIPEPPHDAIDQSVARAKGRYHRFVKSAGQAMVGDSQAAMQDLVNRAD
jgi:Arc/MetJ-type ribon-helix-helix transcriptional regulator